MHSSGNFKQGGSLAYRCPVRPQTSIRRSPPDSRPIELSVVMPPFLKEAETLDPCMQKCPALLADSGTADESSITDNASTDSSIDTAQRSGARVVHIPARPGAGFRST